MPGLDAELATVIERLEAGGWLPLGFDPATEARERYRALSMARRGPDYVPEAVQTVSDETLDGPGGPLAIRVYEPEGAAAAVLVWLHGGGWVFGDLDTTDPLCRRLARGAGCIVASVDYRLAPEHPHPAALDDAMAALRWAAERWPEHALAVGGDSAGGGLAAGAALRARDEGGPDLAAQLLVYPGLDPAMGEPSTTENAVGYFLTARDMRWFYAQYLPGAGDAEHPHVNLLAAPDLRGLPPAVLANAQFDPLRDESVAYAQRLHDAGVPVTMLEGPGLIHGYFALTDLSAAARERVEDVHRALAQVLKAAGDRPPPPARA
jgi:acetyl esterase